MSLRPQVVSAALGAALCTTPALAQGFSTDIELVRPTYSPRSTFGVDSPFTGGDGHLSVGVQSQYARDPLRLIEFDRVTGPVVRNRFGTHLGFAWAPSERLSLRGGVPIAWQWGSKVEDYRADGLGFGDVTAGLRYRIWGGGGFTLGAHGDFVLNVGTRNAYLGETQPRTAFGLLTAYESGPVLFLGNLGVQTRSGLDTRLDFNLGNELVASAAAVYTLAPDGSALTAELLSRFGMSQLFAGGAESSVEWLVGAQVPTGDHFTVHLGIGRGLTSGYGTSTFRGLASIRYARAPLAPLEEPDFEVSVLDIPEDLLEEEPEEPPPVVVDPTPPGEWREGELARVAVDRIEIREPIQFEFATSRILPVSLPLLRQVASLLNRNGGIGHLLIEGHASQEGSYIYNYDLSIRRARAVYEQLLVLGVHPARMSYRGMGKVMPLTQGEDEASLAENRRVEFQIIHQYAPGDTLPDYDSTVKLPWSGDPAQVQVPREIPTRPRPPTDLLEGPPTDPDERPSPSETEPGVDDDDPLPPPPPIEPDAPDAP